MKTTNLKGISEMKLPARASVYYLLSGVLGKALGFISTLFFTRLLSISEYGEYAVYMGWLGIGEACASAFISGSVIYKGFADFKEKRDTFISTAIATFLIFGTVFCLLLFTFSTHFGFAAKLFPFLFLQILFDGILSIRLLESKHGYKYRTVVIMNFTESVASITISLLLIRYAGLGYIGRVLGYLIPSAAVGCFYLLRGHPPKLDRQIFRYLTKLSLPLLPSAIALALSMQADKLIVDSLMGASAIARYTVVHSVAGCGVFLVTAIGSALHPWINRKLSNKNYDIILDTADPLISLFSSFSVFLIAIAPLAIRILAPNEYTEALPAFAPIALSIIPYFSANLNTVYLIHHGESGAVSRISVASGIIGVCFSLILVRYLGYLGAGLSALISSTVSYIGGAYHLKQREKVQIAPPRHVFKELFVAGIISIAIILSKSSLFLIPLLLIPSAISLVNSAITARKLVFE